MRWAAWTSNQGRSTREVAKVSSAAAGDSGLFLGVDGRERERRRESPGRGAEGVTADISLRVRRLFLSSSSSCPLNQNADRRGRPTWRSKRKSVPSSISARRNRTSAEWVGCQPRNRLWALFLFSKPPAAPLQLLAVQHILGAPYLALQTRLASAACMTAEHGERFLPPAAPPIGTTLRAINEDLRVQRHLSDDAVPLASAPRSDSGPLIMHPEDDSVDPFDGTTTEPPLPRVWSGCGGNHVASGQRMRDSTPPFPACN